MKSSGKQNKLTEAERQRRVILGQELADFERIRERLALLSGYLSERNRRAGK